MSGAVNFAFFNSFFPGWFSNSKPRMASDFLNTPISKSSAAPPLLVLPFAEKDRVIWKETLSTPTKELIMYIPKRRVKFDLLKEQTSVLNKIKQLITAVFSRSNDEDLQSYRQAVPQSSHTLSADIRKRIEIYTKKDQEKLTEQHIRFFAENADLETESDAMKKADELLEQYIRDNQSELKVASKSGTSNVAISTKNNKKKTVTRRSTIPTETTHTFSSSSKSNNFRRHKPKSNSLNVLIEVTEEE